MKRITSLIIVGTEPLTERTVPRVRKSVVDYLVSSRPDPDLHIDLTDQHHSFTTTQRLTFNVGHITSSHGPYEDISISQGITYTCQWFFGRHLENGGERATLVPDVENFMITHFLQWLRVLSLQKLEGSLRCFYVKNFREVDQGENKSPYEIWLLRLLGQE